MSLSVGDTLYRVEEYDPPDEDSLNTWKIEAYQVVKVRKDGFVLDRQAGFGKIRRMNSLGVSFHRSPEEAVAAFVAKKQGNIEHARRVIAESERAIAWSLTQT